MVRKEFLEVLLCRRILSISKTIKYIMVTYSMHYCITKGIIHTIHIRRAIVLPKCSFNRIRYNTELDARKHLHEKQYLHSKTHILKFVVSLTTRVINKTKSTQCDTKRWKFYFLIHDSLKKQCIWPQSRVNFEIRFNWGYTKWNPGSTLVIP